MSILTLFSKIENSLFSRKEPSQNVSTQSDDLDLESGNYYKIYPHRKNLFAIDRLAKQDLELGKGPYSYFIYEDISISDTNNKIIENTFFGIPFIFDKAQNETITASITSEHAKLDTSYNMSDNMILPLHYITS